MSNFLLIEDETGTSRLPLPQGVSRLGSASDCELQLHHEEVQPLALTLDCRGDTLLVHNRNPFAVFVGDEELQPSQMAAWPLGAPLRMTRSITLTLSGNGALQSGQTADDFAPAEKPPTTYKRQMIQLGVIVLCLAVGYQQLTVKPSVAVDEPQESFDDLRKQITATIDAHLKNNDLPEADRWQKALRSLQEAHFLEHRPGRREPTLAIEAYQRVLDTDALSKKSDDPQDLATRIFKFANNRVVRLND
jgi:hypothetical protein